MYIVQLLDEYAVHVYYFQSVCIVSYLFKFFVELFCLDGLSIDESEVLKCPSLLCFALSVLVSSVVFI
jgi:hypothetical protein